MTREMFILFGTVAAILGVVILAVIGYSREMKRRRAEEERREQEEARKREEARLRELAEIEAARSLPPPEGGRYIYIGGESEDIDEQLIGYFLLISVGGFGLNQLQRLLKRLYESGREKLVGAIGVLESDSQQRKLFYHAIPECFRDRLLFAFSDASGGGAGNRPFDERFGCVDSWGVPIAKAGPDLVDLYLRRNPNRAPGMTALFLSLGGQPPDGLLLLEEVHQQFKETRIYGFACLPAHEVLRKRFEQVKAEYEKRGVYGWCLEDALNGDVKTSDDGMVVAVAGLADAALHGNSPTQPNNGFWLALGEKPGGILAYQTVRMGVVGFPFERHPRLPREHYVFGEGLRDQTVKAFRRIEANEGLWSVPGVPIGQEGCVVIDIVVPSVYRTVLPGLSQDVDFARSLLARYGNHNGKNGSSSQDLPGNLYGQPNYMTVFGSLACTIDDPDKAVCPIYIVRLAAIRNDPNLVHDIIKVPSKRSQSPRAQRQAETPRGEEVKPGVTEKNGDEKKTEKAKEKARERAN